MEQKSGKRTWIRVAVFAFLPLVLLGVVGWQLGTNDAKAGDNGPIERMPNDNMGPLSQDEEDRENFRSRDDLLVEIGVRVPGFGGMYIDPENPEMLNVFMLDVNDEEQLQVVEGEIRERFPDVIPEGGVYPVQGEYGITQLKVWYDDIRIAIGSSGLVDRGLVGTDLEEDKNRLEIAVEHPDLIGFVEELAEEAGIPPGVVRVTVRGPFRSFNRVGLGAQTIRDKIRPVIGGVQTEGDTQGLCTQGFNVIRSGSVGVAVNSHCTDTFASKGSTVFYQPEKNADNRIGQEAVDGSLFDCPKYPWIGKKCRLADVAFIKFDQGIKYDMGHIARTTGNGSITINASNPRWRVVSESSSGVVGQIIVMVGSTTGTYTPIIYDLCMDVLNVDENVVMQCQDIGTAPHTGPGDSGAPIFKITNSPKNGDVNLYGIMWGGNSDHIVYSPMDQIQNWRELGSIRTCALEIGC